MGKARARTSRRRTTPFCASQFSSDPPNILPEPQLHLLRSFALHMFPKSIHQQFRLRESDSLCEAEETLRKHQNTGCHKQTSEEYLCEWNSHHRGARTARTALPLDLWISP